MACHLFGAKPLPEPLLAYCQLDAWEQTSVKFESKYQNFSFKKIYLKCCLRNGGHFVAASMCWGNWGIGTLLSHGLDQVEETSLLLLNTLRPRQGGCHFADDIFNCIFSNNKANLRDLIAATGLVILLKLDSNRQFFSPCDLEIWWMTSKNYRAHCIKLCASTQTPRRIQTGVTVRKRSIRVNIDDFLSRVTLKFDGWP